MAIEMIELTRPTGGSAKIRKDQIEKVLRVIEERPGLTARDVSIQTHVTADNINWILECHEKGQDLVRAGKVARPSRGPMPRWANLVDPAIIPEPNTENALVAIRSSLAALPASITSRLAVAESDAAIQGIAKLLRSTGGSSPTRAKQANIIIETSISQLAYHLQKAEEAAGELREALRETVEEKDDLQDRDEHREKTIEVLRKHIAVLEERAEGYKMMNGLLEDRWAAEATAEKR